MSKSVVFYFVMSILFLSINGGAYFVLFAPTLEQYKEQQDSLDRKRIQRKSIQTKLEEIQLYKAIEPTYLKNNEFYEKWVKKTFSSTEIKVYLHNLGKKMHLKIEPEEKKEGSKIVEGDQTPQMAETPMNAFATYEINSFFTPKQLKQYLSALINNREKLFLITAMDAIAVSIDEPKLAGIPVSEKESYLKVRLLLDYVFFLPTEVPQEE